jgi:hypothetical protein
MLKKAQRGWHGKGSGGSGAGLSANVFQDDQGQRCLQLGRPM